jgi:predicted  nucleic acid-binding Zn-ribbon protein
MTADQRDEAGTTQESLSASACSAAQTLSFSCPDPDSDAQRSLWSEMDEEYEAAQQEHEQALCKLEAQVEELGQEFEREVAITESQVEQALAGLTMKLTACERQDKNAMREHDKLRAEATILRQERAMLIAELRDLKCIASKSQVQREATHRQYERSKTESTCAEARAEEAEAGITRESAKVAEWKLVTRYVSCASCHEA